MELRSIERRFEEIGLMIRCDEAVKLLEPYLDRELPDEDVRDLEEHLAQCDHCFGHAKFDAALRKLIRSNSLRAKLSPEVRARILQNLQL